MNILRLQESGIIDQLLRNAHRSNSKFQVPKKIEIKLQKRLNAKDIKIVSFILLVGYLIAFLVFLGELIVWKVRLRVLQLHN